MTTIEATWAVTYRNPDTDDLLFLFFLPVVAEPRDRIQTVVEAIFKQRFPKGPLWQRHPDDFVYLFHEVCSRVLFELILTAWSVPSFHNGHVQSTNRTPQSSITSQLRSLLTI